MALAPSQRAQLVDTLNSLSDEQWAAETMCAGWGAGDLSAHLLAREREPLASPGVVLGGPFATYFAKRMRARKAEGRERLIVQLANGPTWWMSKGPMDSVQAVEDWIHHEDVRRGSAGVPGRTTSPEMAEPLWAAAKRFARVTLTHTRVEGGSQRATVALTDGDRRATFEIAPGSRAARPSEAEPDATVTGSPGELVLFATGRSQAAVQITGDEALSRALSSGKRRV